jgi:hypothetical protein
VKAILLKQIPDPRFPVPSDPGYEVNLIDYRLLIENVIRTPMDKQAGVGMDEMRKGIRVLDALDAAGQTLLLEDADYDHLKTKTERMSWGLVDRRVLTFIDDVMQATDSVTVNGQIAEPV